MNKICTTIEQSKKLMKLGIDINTADMCWTNHLFNAFLSSWRIESTPPQEYKSLLDRFVVKGYLIEPAWSLSALLELAPKNENLEFSICFGGYKGDEYISEWFCTFEKLVENLEESIFITTHSNSAINALFEMIVKLKEQNLI